MPDNENRKIGVYWDFENIHAVLCDSHYHQPNWYGGYTIKKYPDGEPIINEMGDTVRHYNRWKHQEEIINITAIMDYIGSLGTISINKAYSNWSNFASYSASLNKYSFDLIQLFSKGSNAKNGADIRMAIDIIEDMNRYSHLDTIVIIGCDSDYLSIGQKIHQAGKVLIGIGVKDRTNVNWIHACNEFRYYSSLLKMTGAEKEDEEEEISVDEIEHARNLVTKSIKSISTLVERDYLTGSELKNKMLQLDPSFNHTNYDCDKFVDFLYKFPELLSVDSLAHGDIRVIPNISSKKSNIMIKDETRIRVMNNYATALLKGGIKMVHPKILRKSVNLAFHNILIDRNFHRLDDFTINLLEMTEANSVIYSSGLNVKKEDISEVVNLLLSAGIIYHEKFYDDDGNVTINIKIKENMYSVKHIFNLIYSKIITTIINYYNDKIDFEALYEFLYGDTQYYSEEFHNILDKLGLDFEK